MKQVDQFVTFIVAYELKRFISENIKTCAIAWKFDMGITLLLNHCISNFSENIYVVDFNEGYIAAQESTNVLQKEGDKSLSLGMPMHLKEDECTGEEQEKEDKEEKVEEEWSSYPSSSPNNGNEQIPMKTPSYTIASNDDIYCDKPILDDSLPDSPLCGKIVSNIWEDENDINEIDCTLFSFDDKSLCGDSIKNFANEFSFNACKYNERGGNKSSPYVSNLF